MAAPIGLVVNPRSGSDVRRVLAAAASSTLEDKVAIVRRVARGALAVGADRFVTNREPHQIVRRAVGTMASVQVERLDGPVRGDEGDTEAAVAAMRARGCAVVVVLGGDGTNRAAAKAWPAFPVVPLSTGTNNAFPYWFEPTVAGAAAGLVATGALEGVPSPFRPAKVVEVAMPQGPDELALVDAVAVDDPWVGSLELFDPDTVRLAVLTRADPAGIGFSAVGGLLSPLRPDEDGGLVVRFAPPVPGTSRTLSAPTAPGHFARLGVAGWHRVAEGEPVRVDGPTVLAFDGERKRRLGAGEWATLTVTRRGPRVLDVGQAMAAAATLGLFVGQSTGATSKGSEP